MDIITILFICCLIIWICNLIVLTWICHNETQQQYRVIRLDNTL